MRSERAPMSTGTTSAKTPSAPIRAPATAGEANSLTRTGAYADTTVIAADSASAGSASWMRNPRGRGAVVSGSAT